MRLPVGLAVAAMPVAAMGLAARLQQMPAGAFALPAAPEAPPPPPPAPAVGMATADGEVFSSTFDWNGAAGRELVLAATQKPWKSLDVYVAPSVPNAAVAGALSFFVYAVTGTMKTLVASGRFVISPFGVGVGIVDVPRWVVAARHLATRFEVTVRWNQPSVAGNQGGNAAVTILASNDDALAPPGVGVEPLNHLGLNSGLTSIGLSIPGVPSVDKPEVVSVRGASGAAAAARFIQMFDQPGDPVNGQTPLHVWPLGSAAGQGVVDTDFRYRARSGLSFVSSSTALTLTQTFDAAISVLAR